MRKIFLMICSKSGGFVESMNLKAFGKRVKEVRQARCMTGDAMAEKCDITPTFLRQIESGVKGVSVDNLINICNVLNVSPDYLLHEDLYTLQTSVETKEDFIQFVRKIDERSFRLFLNIIKAIQI